MEGNSSSAKGSIYTDVNNVQGIVLHLLSSDNGMRKQAEAALTQLKNNPQGYEQVVAILLHLLEHSDRTDVKQISAVLVRQAIKGDLVSSQPSVSNAISKLQQLVSSTTERGVYKHVIDACSAAAVKHFSKWSNLLPFLSSLSGSPQQLHQEAALSIITQLAEFQFDFLAPHLHSILPFIIKSMEVPSPDIRLAAVRAIVSILLSVPDSFSDEAQQIVPFLFQTLAGSSDEFLTREMLGDLIQLASGKPSFFMSKNENIFSACLAISNNKSCEISTRTLSFEFLLTLSEHLGTVLQDTELPADLVKLCFAFLMEFDSDIDWNDSKHDDEQESFNLGLSGLVQLAEFYGPNHVYLTAKSCMQQILIEGSVVQQYAGMMAISKVSEGCPEQIYRDLEEYVSLCVSMMKHNDPRLRFSALSAMTSFSSFVQDFEQNFFDPVIQTCLSTLQSETHPRVVASLCQFLASFCNESSHEQLDPFIDTLLQKMLQNLQHPPSPEILENSLMVISSVSSVISEAGVPFEPYYNVFFPLVRDLMHNCSSAEYSLLRGKCMECIGHLGKAVGKERFKQDAQLILQYLIGIQQSGISADDLSYSYVQQTFSRIAQVLENDFAPYLDFVIPRLLESAQLDSCCVVEDGEASMFHQGGTPENSHVMNIAIRGVGEKRVTINTTSIQEKSIACNMLYQYVVDLEAGFGPFIDQTVNVLIPLMDCNFSEEVRIASVSSMAPLMKASCLARKDSCQQLFNRILPRLLDVSAREPDLYALLSIEVAISDLLKEYPGQLSSKQLSDITKILESLVQESNARRSETAQGESEEESVENELIANVVGCLEQLFKKHSPTFLSMFEQRLSKLFRDMLDSTNFSLITSALCVFDHLIENAADRATAYVQSLVPIYIRFALHQDEDVRHSAVYGLGASAKSSGRTFLQYRDAAMNALLQVIHSKDARSPKNNAATDNAISAFGKIILYCGEGLDVGSLLPQWLQFLPIRSDPEEARSATGSLVQLLSLHGQRILQSRDIAVYSIVLSTIAFAHAPEDGFPVSSQAVDLVRYLFAHFPTEAWKAAQSLSEEEQAVLNVFIQ